MSAIAPDALLRVCPVMWMYFLVFVATLVVDSIPVFAPPAWTVLLLLLLLLLHLNPWVVVIIGVTGSTLGRYILSAYIPKVWLAWSTTARIRTCVTSEASSRKRHLWRRYSFFSTP